MNTAEKVRFCIYSMGKKLSVRHRVQATSESRQASSPVDKEVFFFFFQEGKDLVLKILSGALSPFFRKFPWLSE
jgi:hypothetical protein